MDIPEDLLYTKEHEWVRIKGKTATIGITDYAQRLLGDITFVELPEINDKVVQFKQFAMVESVKAASDVYSPLSGRVIKINESIIDSPELVNQSPYDKGWFCIIEIDNGGEKKNLLSQEAYRSYTEGLPK